MQSFRQKFSEMVKEYRDGFKMQSQEKKIMIEGELKCLKIREGV